MAGRRDPSRTELIPSEDNKVLLKLLDRLTAYRSALDLIPKSSIAQSMIRGYLDNKWLDDPEMERRALQALAKHVAPLGRDFVDAIKVQLQIIGDREMSERNQAKIRAELAAQARAVLRDILGTAQLSDDDRLRIEALIDNVK